MQNLMVIDSPCLASFIYKVMHFDLAVQIVFYVPRNGRKQAAIVFQIFTCAFIHRKFYLSGNNLGEILCSLIFFIEEENIH
jgi:hypothetical protein